MDDTSIHCCFDQLHEVVSYTIVAEIDHLHHVPLPQSDTEVQMLVAILNDALSENDEACMRLKAQYDAFSYLWLTDM